MGMKSVQFSFVLFLYILFLMSFPKITSSLKKIYTSVHISMSWGEKE